MNTAMIPKGQRPPLLTFHVPKVTTWFLPVPDPTFMVKVECECGHYSGHLSDNWPREKNAWIAHTKTYRW